MQATLIPEVTKIEAEDRATWIIGTYRVHVLPSHKLVVTKEDYFTGKQKDFHTESCESHADAMETAAEWVAIAIENETIWGDEE